MITAKKGRAAIAGQGVRATQPSEAPCASPVWEIQLEKGTRKDSGPRKEAEKLSHMAFCSKLKTLNFILKTLG